MNLTHEYEQAINKQRHNVSVGTVINTTPSINQQSSWYTTSVTLNQKDKIELLIRVLQTNITKSFRKVVERKLEDLTSNF